LNHSWGYGSDQRQRNENQDSFGLFSFPGFTLGIVCDGMGGHVGGAQASALAVRAVHEYLSDTTEDLPRAIEKAIQHANQAIYDAARKDHRLMGMGTTIVLAAATEDQCYIAHVGDSRAYLVRSSRVEPLTRDHTMVNLFVDAELLTPEDAATHPEAHVLSRSLGVERQVDVEVAEPIALEAGDSFFLCSDGVHGVVNDWEFANIDWSLPTDAVHHVMGIVEAREGDDNATAVVLRNAPSTQASRVTQLPELRSLDDVLEPSNRPGSLSASPAMTRPRNIEPPGYDLDDEPHSGGLPVETEPQQTQQPDLQSSGYVIYEGGETEAQPQPEPARPSARRQAEIRGGRKRRRNRPMLLVIGAVGIALALCLGVVAISLPSGPAAGDEVAMLDVTAPDGMAPAQPPPSPSELSPSEYEPTTSLFAPKLPADPRRLPKRPQIYTQPPPGGATQWAAVQAARNRDCAKALDVVKNGMLVSMDHAPLYDSAWKCFNDTHQRMLAQAEVERPEDFSFLVHHFEGPPDEREERESAEVKALPIWFRPAVGGIEYRLEAWSKSGPEDLMIEVLADLIGEPSVADHLARDLLMEAEAAAGLSRVEDPDEQVIDWWARRVFVTTRAMHGRPGRLLEQHRANVVPRIRALLAEATTPRAPEDIPKRAAVTAVSADGATEPEGMWDDSGLPRAVALAQAAALGARLPFARPAPVEPSPAAKAKTRSVVRAPAPTGPVEPPTAKIYRLGSPVIRSEP
jgi:serine/threonine protein phosphatase PrpC